MSTFGRRGILIKIDELPKINGEYIKAIYKCVFDIRGVNRVSIPEEFKSTYYSCSPYFYDRPSIIIKNLPKDFEKLFGHVTAEEYYYDDPPKIETKIITSMMYRVNDSGHGGFIDESVSLDGHWPPSGQSTSFHLRRTLDNSGIKEDSDIGRAILNTLNKEYTIKEMEPHEYTYYDSTTLRKVNGKWYPDPHCSGWRSPTRMPYASYDNGKNMRIFNESLDCEVVVKKVDDEDIYEGGEYLMIDFPRDYRDEPYHYCFIKSWAHFKENNPNGMIKYRVDKICNNGVLKCSRMDNEKVTERVETTKDYLYKINIIKNVYEKES